MSPKRQIFAEYPRDKSFSVEFVVTPAGTLARITTEDGEFNLGVSDVFDGVEGEEGEEGRG